MRSRPSSTIVFSLKPPSVWKAVFLMIIILSRRKFGLSLKLSSKNKFRDVARALLEGFMMSGLIQVVRRSVGSSSN